MGAVEVPATLQDRLGVEATGGLVELLNRAGSSWKEDVIAVCAERFERRLVEEIAGVRVQIGHTEAALRTEMREGDAALRQEIAQRGAALREEIAQMGASLRGEMVQMGAQLRRETTELGAALRREMTDMGASLRQDTTLLGAALRQDMANGRVELLKWCFIFWIGQVVAVATVVGVMLRLFRP
jgi:hypothetical protein